MYAGEFRDTEEAKVYWYAPESKGYNVELNNKIQAIINIISKIKKYNEKIRS